MQDKQAHIDILFRNGLRELEVLPPPDVWHNIAPVVASRVRRNLFFSIAASIAVLVGMASSLWLLTGNIPLTPVPGTLTLNQDARPAGTTVTGRRYVESSTTIRQPVQIPVAYIEDKPDDGSRPAYKYISPGEFPEFVIAEPVDFESGSALTDGETNEIMFPINVISTKFLPEDPYSAELSEVSEGKISRWLIGGGFSPSYSLKTFSGDPEIRDMVNSEKAMISYSGGVSVSFRFSNRLSISTGFFYSNVGQRIDNLSTYSGFAPYNASKGSGTMTVGTTSGRIVTTNPDIYLFDKAGDRVTSGYGNDVFDPVKAGLPYSGNYLVQTFGYLELPMLLRYKLIDRMVDLNIIGGVSYGVLVGNSVNAISLTGEKIPAGYTAGMSPFNISSSMGMGMEYNLSGTLIFNVEPLLRYNITSLGYETTGLPHPWSFGILTGFYFRF